MKIDLVHHYNENYQEMYDLVAPRFIEFCSLNQYDYNCVKAEGLTKDQSLNLKLNVLQDALNKTKADYIIYLDIDILIKDTGYNIFEGYNFTKDITFSKDQYGFCCGAMIMKVSKFTKKFFDTCLFVGEHLEKNCPISKSLHEWNGQYDQGAGHDQELMKSLYFSYPNIRNNIDPDLPEGIISNPFSTQNEKYESFAHHYWSRSSGLKNTIARIQADLHE